MCLAKRVLAVSDLGVVVSLHNVLNEMNKMKRLLFFRTSRCRDRHCLAGDQLQRDVQHWLSPPDPSKNHDFVWKAHHTGTSAWFFESEVLTEWKSSGSLLWIHGKRRSPQLRVRACINGFIVQLGRARVHFCVYCYNSITVDRSWNLSDQRS